MGSRIQSNQFGNGSTGCDLDRSVQSMALSTQSKQDSAADASMVVDKA